MSAERTKTKITMTIWDDLFNHFSKRLDSCFIKRDAFLNHAIRVEVDHLTKGLAGLKNSPEAKKYISASLKGMGTKTINVVVDKEVAEALNKVVKKHNLVRDAFINRLLLLLSFPQPAIKYFFGVELRSEISVHDEHKTTYHDMGELPRTFGDALEEIQKSPNFYIQEELNIHFDSTDLEGNIYLKNLDMYPIEAIQKHSSDRTRKILGTLHDNLSALSCYLDDVNVPGTDAYKSAHTKANQTLDDLDLSAILDDLKELPEKPKKGL